MSSVEPAGEQVAAGEDILLAGTRGSLLIIGGHEDRTEALLILRRFVAAAGGSAARIVLLSNASALPELYVPVYTAAFQQIGVQSFQAVGAETRAQANDPALAAMIGQATGLMISGGEQLRLVSEIGGTLVERAIHNLYQLGGVVAGTSAGAAAMGETIILQGPSTPMVRRGLVELGPGLDLINNLLIDQHFDQRQRLYRLISALALNPGQLAVGIDEDTALFVGPDGVAEVIGAGAVTILDGSAVSYTNVAEAHSNQPVAIVGLTLHILTAGLRFDLSGRKPLTGP